MFVHYERAYPSKSILLSPLQVIPFHFFRALFPPDLSNISGVLHVVLDHPGNIALPFFGQACLEFQWHHHVPDGDF